jgi:hypothetical protein
MQHALERKRRMYALGLLAGGIAHDFINILQPSLKDMHEVAVGEMETQYLQELLRQTLSDIKIACWVSELSRSRLYALLKKYEIS